MVHEKAPLSVDICMQTKGVCEAVKTIATMKQLADGRMEPPKPIGRMDQNDDGMPISHLLKK